MKYIIAIGVLFAVLFGCAAIVLPGTEEAVDTSASTNTEQTNEPADEPTEEAPEEEAPEPTEEPEPTLTAGQENALQSAVSYLDYSAFSKEGLIEQLKFEGYSHRDAKWAANHVQVDWMEQAAESAKDYLDYSAFSRQGLIEQLMFEGYTAAQAEYGATAAGL